MNKDYPRVLEIIFVAAVPTLAFIGWVIYILAPHLFL